MSKEEIEKEAFDCILKNKLDVMEKLFSEHKLNPNLANKDGMTLVQHASYKGHIDIVKFLLKMGADVHYTKHEHGYTALHFAALSGNAELCVLLLQAGSKSHSLNSVNRTPAQLAAFVGHYNCAMVINNYIPKSDVDYYTIIRGVETEPKLPAFLSEPLYNYIMLINIHPIRLALSVPKVLLDNASRVNKVMELMCEKEIKKGCETNEVLAFKIHYLRFIFCELNKCRSEKQTDSVEIFAKRILRGSRGEDYLEQLLRDCVREFPFRDGILFQQMVKNLAKRGANGPSALSLIISAINGQRNFLNEDTSCFTCDQPNAIKKCSKCKAVQYCDRECQRLHWFMHKKCCTRLSTINNAGQENSAENENVEMINASQTPSTDPAISNDIGNKLEQLKVN